MKWSALYIWRKVDGRTERVGLLPWDEDEESWYGSPLDGQGPVVYPKVEWKCSAIGAKS